MNTQEELQDWLKERGFQTSPNVPTSFENECRWYVWKLYPAKYVCECNYNKSGILVVVTPHFLRVQGADYKAVEISVTGEANGIWYKLQAYSLSWDELPNKFEQAIDTLIKAWDALPRKEK